MQGFLIRRLLNQRPLCKIAVNKAKIAGSPLTYVFHAQLPRRSISKSTGALTLRMDVNGEPGRREDDHTKSLVEKIAKLKASLEDASTKRAEVDRISSAKDDTISLLEEDNRRILDEQSNLSNELADSKKKVNSLDSQHSADLEKLENEREKLEKAVSMRDDHLESLSNSFQLLLTERHALLAENQQAHSERTELQHLFDTTLDNIHDSDREVAALIHGTSADQATKCIPGDHPTQSIHFSTQGLEEHIKQLEQQKHHFEIMALQLEHDYDDVLRAFATLAQNAHEVARTKQVNAVRVDSLYRGDETSSNIIQEVFNQLDLALKNKKPRRQNRKKSSKKSKQQHNEESSLPPQQVDEGERSDEDGEIRIEETAAHADEAGPSISQDQEDSSSLTHAEQAGPNSPVKTSREDVSNSAGKRRADDSSNDPPTAEASPSSGPRKLDNTMDAFTASTETKSDAAPIISPRFVDSGTQTLTEDPPDRKTNGSEAEQGEDTSDAISVHKQQHLETVEFEQPPEVPPPAPPTTHSQTTQTDIPIISNASKTTQTFQHNTSQFTQTSPASTSSDTIQHHESPSSHFLTILYLIISLFFLISFLVYALYMIWLASQERDLWLAANENTRRAGVYLVKGMDWKAYLLRSFGVQIEVVDIFAKDFTGPEW